MRNDSREKILRRIREALALPAPARHLDGSAAPSEIDTQKWLPPVPPAPAERLDLFRKHCSDLKTEFVLCADAGEATAALADLAKTNGWRSVASHRFALGEGAVEALGLPVVWTDQPYETLALERCDAGVSGCECLVAQTGGILVTSASSGSRALSVLPPHHVVIASSAQLVADLSHALALLKKNGGPTPAFASFITGPSRTGDIERILVLGAHGPKKLTVLFVQA